MQSYQQLQQTRDRSNQRTSNNIDKHVRSFQREIRQRRVQDERSQIRQNLLVSMSDKRSCRQKSLLHSLSTELAQLNNINLLKILKDLQYINEYDVAQELAVIDQITEKLLLYLGSTQRFHLFELIELAEVEKLARLIRWQNLPYYEPKPRIFIRILLILCKHTGETQEVPVCFLETLQFILSHLVSLKDWHEDRQKFLYFSHSQLKHIVELVFESLSNIGLVREQFHRFFFKSDGFLHSALEQAAKIARFLQNHEINENSKEIQILQRIILLFQKIFQYRVNEQNQPQPILQQILLNYDFEMMNYLLQILRLPLDKCQPVEQYISAAILTFLQNYIQTKPEIIISHDFTILFQRVHKCNKEYLDLQQRIHQQKKESLTESYPHALLQQLNKRLKLASRRYVKWLQVVETFFGVTIPTQDESTYYDLFEKWVEDYIIPIFSSTLSNHQYEMTNVIEKILAILCNVCLQETLLQQILEELPILNKIFYFAKSEHSSLRQRKNSLKCITNILKVALDGQSSVKDIVKDLVYSNRVIAIVAEYLGNYVDIQLNFGLLQALKILLESQPCEINQENRFWLIFCQEGGRVKLEKMIGIGRSKQTEELDRLAQSILNDYCVEDI